MSDSYLPADKRAQRRADLAIAKHQQNKDRIEYDPHQRGNLFARIMTDSVLLDYKIIDRDSCDKDVDLSRRISTFEIAKDCLSLHGKRVDGTNAEVIARAMQMDNVNHFSRAYSSDSFPSILDNVASKSMTLGYNRAPEVWPFICRQTSTKDYRSFTRIQSPELPTPGKIVEGGEISRPTLGADSKETSAVGGYPFLIGISRQALISDDLSALTVTAESAGRAASRLKGDIVFAVLTDNNAMADAITLFHSSHANVGTGGVPSATTLNEFRTLMGSQTGPSGETLNIRPAILLGPPGLESTLVALANQAALPDPLTPGYLAGKISVVTDSRLSGTAYYGIGAPEIHSGIEMVTLENSELPMLERQTVWVSDAIDWKVHTDCTALAVDFRSMTYNAGA